MNWHWFNWVVILLYFVGTVIITFLVSALILRKQEIH